MHARYLPMVVPPKRWEAPELGGYLAETVGVMRVRGRAKQRRLLDLFSLDQIYDGLNVLAATRRAMSAA